MLSGFTESLKHSAAVAAEFLDFSLFYVESTATPEDYRNQLLAEIENLIPVFFPPYPLLPFCIRWMSISVSFPFRTNLSFFTTGYLQLQSVPNSIGF